jgi:ferredoxin--NADP+ reductase
MKIINKEVLIDTQGTRIVRLDILSADIAREARPGQFVVLMAQEQGERIPLTIVSSQDEAITVILQEAGLTTRLLGRLNPGDSLFALVGPLGHPTPIKQYGKVIIIGGGVGIAEIYPVAKALKKAGNQITTILGARSKDLLILEQELKSVSDELKLTTDDGSYGRKGFVTDVLGEILNSETQAKRCTLIYAVGPIPMMKRVTQVSSPFGVKTIVSLNALMVDATGMCGCCRVSVAGQTRFSCVDGPEFDGSLVDWEELTKRNRIYEEKERHVCKLLT